MTQDTNELLLIEMRPEAPLVRTKREFDGFPQGTLGYIAGVDALFVSVRLAGSDEASLLLATEVENV